MFVGCFTLFDGYRHCYGRLDIKILLEMKPGFHSFGMSMSLVGNECTCTALLIVTYLASDSHGLHNWSGKRGLSVVVF